MKQQLQESTGASRSGPEIEDADVEVMEMRGQESPKLDPQQYLRTIQSLSDEIGSLVNFGDSAPLVYFGSPSGITLMKIFLTEVKMKDLDTVNRQTKRQRTMHFGNEFISGALIPRKKLATYLFGMYIEYLHIYFPLISIPDTRKSLEALYIDPHSLDARQKFNLYMIFALASKVCQKSDEYLMFHDGNTPEEYYNTAAKCFEEVINTTDNGLRAMTLMVIWKKMSTFSSQYDEVWLLCRTCVTIAVQMGLHRFKKSWELPKLEIEQRNRLWWSIYRLERECAIDTGRTLSIRNGAINANFPRFNQDLDHMVEIEQDLAPTYYKLTVRPFLYAIKFSQLGGDIIESIYIPRTNTLSSLKPVSDQVIETAFNNIKRQLDKLHKETEEELGDFPLVTKNLSLLYYYDTFLMARPSPSMNIIAREAGMHYISQCQRSLEISTDLFNMNGLVPSWYTLKQTFYVGIFLLYIEAKFPGCQHSLFKFTILNLFDQFQQHIPFASKLKEIFITLSSISLKNDGSQPKKGHTANFSSIVDELWNFEWWDSTDWIYEALMESANYME